MQTKERILKAALNLYNSKGTESVTVRHIAEKVGMSHGNLCYHFPTTDHIIEQLYFNLVQEIDLEMNAMQEANQKPEDVFKGTRNLFSLLYKYKFLMLNFVDIMRRIPKLHKHYRQLQQRRQTEFKNVFSNLVKVGIMRPELYPGFFNDLNVNMTILGDFWISHAEILYDGQEKDKLEYFYKATGSILLPMLTETGLALFMESTRKGK